MDSEAAARGLWVALAAFLVAALVLFPLCARAQVGPGAAAMVGADRCYDKSCRVKSLVLTTGTLTDSSGAVTVADDLDVSGTLTAGAVSFSSLVVTGTSDLRGAVSNTGGTNGGRLYVGDSFEVLNQSYFRDTASFEAILVADSISNASGNVAVGDSLDVNGILTANSTIDAQGAISNTTASNSGTVYVNDALQVTGSSQLVGVTATGSTDLQNTLNVHGTITNTSGTNGGVVYVGDAFTATGALVAGSTIDAQGAVSNTTATNGGYVYVNDGLDVVGSAGIINSSANNSGYVLLNDGVILNSAVVGNGTWDHQGSGGIVNTGANNSGRVYVNDAFQATGAATFSSTIDAQGAISDSNSAVQVSDSFQLGSSGGTFENVRSCSGVLDFANLATGGEEVLTVSCGGTISVGSACVLGFALNTTGGAVGSNFMCWPSDTNIVSIRHTCDGAATCNPASQSFFVVLFEM
jgi:hypothetical protein